MKMKRLWRKCDYFPCFFFSARWCSLHLIFVCFLKYYHFDLKKWKKFEQVFFFIRIFNFFCRRSVNEVGPPQSCWGRGTPHISVWDFLMTSSGLVSGPPTIDHFVWYSRPRSARRVLHWCSIWESFNVKYDLAFEIWLIEFDGFGLKARAWRHRRGCLNRSATARTSSWARRNLDIQTHRRARNANAYLSP